MVMKPNFSQNMNHWVQYMCHHRDAKRCIADKKFRFIW